jgi:hypothetical protein
MKIKTHIEVANKDFYKAMFEMSQQQKVQLPFDDIIEYVEAVGSYNNFDANKIKGFLYEMDKLIPRKNYGGDNPNNGLRDYKISFGREGSPVMYVEMFYYADVRSFAEVKKNWDEIKRLSEIMALADEADMETEENQLYNSKVIKMRFWWD